MGKLFKARKKGKGYESVSRDEIQREDMTWKATGIYCYLVSLPDGWRVNRDDMKRRKKDGQCSTDSGMRELRKLGFLHTLRRRQPTGRVESVTLFYEHPTNDPSWDDVTVPQDDVS